MYQLLRHPPAHFRRWVLFSKAALEYFSRVPLKMLTRVNIFSFIGCLGMLLLHRVIYADAVNVHELQHDHLHVQQELAQGYNH